MLLECEGKPPILSPTASQVRKTILGLKSYGPSSYASLTDEEGNYLQVAGGGVTCLLERYQVLDKQRLRSYCDIVNKACPDGTLLVCRVGKIPMMSDEWFVADKVAQAFCAFLEGKDFPAGIHWRPAPKSAAPPT